MKMTRVDLVAGHSLLMSEMPKSVDGAVEVPLTASSVLQSRDCLPTVQSVERLEGSKRLGRPERLSSAKGP
jgi:hypothetical protein